MKALSSTKGLFFTLCIVYALTRLIFLTRLPVFADEAIYIRWAQVGQNEPEKYLFLSMLDGKPPLHNWLIVPFMRIFSDPLLGSRILSVVAGSVNVVCIYYLLKELTKNKTTALWGSVLAVASPFFLINHRMGLAESLLALFFTMSLYFGILSLKHHDSSKKNILYAIGFALSWGLALWTKTNALFFAFSYVLLPFLLGKANQKETKKNLVYIAIGGLGAILIFLGLKFTPLFSFLFSRSKDYTFTIQELIDGQWRHVLTTSLPRTMWWLTWYLTPFLIPIIFFENKKNKIILLMALAYMTPLIILGKILSARYFFPIAPLFIVMISLGIEQSIKNARLWNISRTLLFFSAIFSILFTTFHIVWPDKTWYVESDRKQYLEEWSSGHGIPQVRDFLKKRLKDTQVVVATEGYFGTLPDGLMMYFDRTQEIQNLELYGIGQPIVSIPKDLYEKAKTKEVYVVANAHRFLIPLSPSIQKVGEYNRPNNAPPLLLVKISAL